MRRLAAGWEAGALFAFAAEDWVPEGLRAEAAGLERRTLARFVGFAMSLRGL
jgi:hypothetical protein